MYVYGLIVKKCIYDYEYSEVYTNRTTACQNAIEKILTYGNECNYSQDSINRVVNSLLLWKTGRKIASLGELKITLEKTELIDD